MRRRLWVGRRTFRGVSEGEVVEVYEEKEDCHHSIIAES